VANVVSLRRMELIRRYYAALAPGAAAYFGVGLSTGGSRAARYGRLSFLFTMASMVIVVNSVLGGATAALVGTLAIKAPIAAATGVGVAIGLALLGLCLLYEHRRLTPAVLSSFIPADGGHDPGAARRARLGDDDYR